MAASDSLHENVELLLPPEGSIPGERIWFGSEDEKGNQPDAATPNQVKKIALNNLDPAGLECHFIMLHISVQILT